MNQSLHKLLVHEIQDLYDAEHQLAEELPKLSAEADSPDLKEAFMTHAGETEDQIRKLEEVFASLRAEPRRTPCVAIKGILQEGKQTLKEAGTDGQARDAALVGSAQRVEHYEMAAYESAWTLAMSMDHADAAGMLEDIREEEAKTSKSLTAMGKRVVGMTMGQRLRGMVA